MRPFDNGVRYYTKATVEIGFPEDDVSCTWCPLLGVELRSDRKYCRKTGEYLVYPTTGIGFECPLKFEEIKVDTKTGEVLEEKL